MEESAESIPQYTTNDFSQESLLDAWKKFSQTIEKDMPRLHQVISSHLPQRMAENKIKLLLDNSSQQKDFLEKIQSNLVAFLKTELNIPSLEIDIEISEDTTNKSVIYTASDKYKYLAEQNELLNDLKKVFNLDFE